MQLLAPLIISVLLVGEFCQTDQLFRKRNYNFKKIDDWLNEQGLSRPGETMAKVAEYLEQHSNEMSKDELVAWIHFTALGKINEGTRCNRRTTDLFLTNARESGFKWYQTAEQELTIQKIIEKLAIRNAKVCQRYFNTEIESKVEQLDGFELIRDLAWVFASDYGFKHLKFAPDSEHVVSLFETIRTGNPALVGNAVNHTKVSTSYAIVRAFQLRWLERGFGTMLLADPDTGKYNTANIETAVDYIFSNCRKFINNEVVKELIPPIEAYAKFYYHSMSFFFIYPAPAWFGYKLCENFLQRDQREVTAELNQHLEANPRENCTVCKLYDF